MTKLSRGLPMAMAGLLPVLSGIVACHDLAGLAGKQALPAGVADPSVYHTAAGAMELYRAAQSVFVSSTGGGTGSSARGAFVDAMLTSGVLSDELQAGDYGVALASGLELLDARGAVDVDSIFNAYGGLQQVRGNASLAIGDLATYDSAASPALRGQLYAQIGYAEILLADLFCSGIPLSTLDFVGDYTYHAGSTTTQVYQASIAQFDSALALSADSARIQNLAWVGKGRAFLDLGLYATAAAAAAHVPTDFSYQVQVDWRCCDVQAGVFGVLLVSVADSEGKNGLPFVSSGDPRTASQPEIGQTLEMPVKYGGNTPDIYPVTVADGIEARLIQAEAAYHGVVTGSGTWLDQLNALRATAITPALPMLTDPGIGRSAVAADSARVKLLFQERAYWLFLTGHRLGDLRRLVRNYGYSPESVFPTGRYVGSKTIFEYGTGVALPIPSTETLNPLFRGCLSQGA